MRLKALMWALAVAIVVLYGVMGYFDREAEEAATPDYAGLQRMHNLATEK